MRREKGLARAARFPRPPTLDSRSLDTRILGRDTASGRVQVKQVFRKVDLQGLVSLPLEGEAPQVRTRSEGDASPIADNNDPVDELRDEDVTLGLPQKPGTFSPAGESALLMADGESERLLLNDMMGGDGRTEESNKQRCLFKQVLPPAPYLSINQPPATLSLALGKARPRLSLLHIEECAPALDYARASPRNHGRPLDRCSATFTCPDYLRLHLRASQPEITPNLVISRPAWFWITST